jgi:DNA-binding FrmR family transcriptional regulator
VLELIAGARDALSGLLAELLDDYIRTYIVDSSEAEQASAAVELLDLIRSYLR